ANVVIPMGVLLGDTTNSGIVNASDIGQTKAVSGQTAVSANFRNDVNVNGVVNASDVSLVKAKSGNQL
ncbi:MAG: dockerin type I domain-containing protein, partial [Verrucomicrobiota bacterium]